MPPKETDAGGQESEDANPKIFANAAKCLRYQVDELKRFHDLGGKRDTRNEEYRKLVQAVNFSTNNFLTTFIPKEKNHHLSPDQKVVISKILTVLSMPHSEDKVEGIRILLPEFLKTIPHQHAHALLSSGSMYRPETPAPFETAFDRLRLKEAEIRQSLAAVSGQNPRDVSDLEVWEALSEAKKKYKAANDPHGSEEESEDEDKDEDEDEDRDEDKDEDEYEEEKASKSTQSQQFTFGGQPYTANWGLEFHVEDLK